MVSSAITGSSRVTSQDVSMVATNVKAGKVNSFGDVMAKSLADNSSVSNDSSSKVDVAVTKESAKTNEPEPVKDEKVDENVTLDKADDAATNEKEEVVAETEEAAKDILEKIKEELNVTDEELAECMEVLGMSLADLLQPGNILKLVMEVTGTQDAMMMVTDADLSESLKNILDYAGARINELADQLNMTSGELQTMLESMETVQTDVEGQVDVAVSEEVVAEKNVSDEIVTEEVVQDETTSESVEDVVASKITVNNTSKSSAENSMNNSNDPQGQMMNSEPKADEVTVHTTISDAVSQLSQSFEAVLGQDVTGVNPADVVRQVVDSIKLNNTQMLQSIEVQLNPENLGKVNVLVSVREGVITAQIMTENEQVKRAIESQMTILKETFEAQGVKVEAVEVTVQSHAFENNQAFDDDKQQDNATSKARKKINLDGLNFDEEEEETAVAAAVHENSSVEYLA